MVVRGYIRWRGQTAEYSPGERQIMRQLPAKEQFVLHILKAFTPGEISQCDRADTVAPLPDLAGGEMFGRAPDPGLDRSAGAGSIPAVGNDRKAVYTDPEDIPFGEKPKRRPKIYALVWTQGKHKVYKTKALAERKRKVWVRWYERQGWKVIGSAAAGFYIAELDGVRHAVNLHEYDKQTKERL